MPLKPEISMKEVLQVSPKESVAVCPPPPPVSEVDDLAISEIDVSPILETSQESAEDLLTHEQRLALISLIRRVNSAPHMFYVPNGACQDYIAAVGNSRKTGKRIFMLSAANGIGKTAVGINIMANIFYDHNPQWFNYPLFTEKWRLPKLFWFITKDSTLRETIEPEIRKWFPEGKYKLTQEGKQHIYKLTTDTGFTVFFKTIDQDPETFESATLGGIFYDEPPPEKIHEACTSRLRAGGYIFAQLTPLHRAAWILDKWVLNEKAHEYLYIKYADIWANSISKGVRGRLKDADIKFMISQLDPAEYEARVKGLFTHLRGLVYKLFANEEPYIIKPFDVSNGYDYQIHCVLDPHDRRFPAIGWYAIDKINNYYIVHEWPNLPDFNGKYFEELGDNTYTFKDIVKKIKGVEIKKGWKNVTWRIIDPNRGRSPYGNSGLTVQEEFEKEGMYFDTDVQDDLTIGHAVVRDLLKIGNLKKPRLQAFNHCRNHIWSFNRYTYDEHTGKSADKKSASENVLDKGKDFMDITRYFSVGLPRFNHSKPIVKGWRAKLKEKNRKQSRNYMAA